jgi:pyrrolidone-carboxylate peptidase
MDIKQALQNVTNDLAAKRFIALMHLAENGEIADISVVNGNTICEEIMYELHHVITEMEHILSNM